MYQAGKNTLIFVLKLCSGLSGPPLNITLTDRSVSSLSFTWDPPGQNKQNGYTVCVSRSHNQPCFKMYTTNDKEIVVRNLNASTKYYVRFSTTTAAGSGNYSEVKGFFTNGSKYINCDNM